MIILDKEITMEIRNDIGLIFKTFRKSRGFSQTKIAGEHLSKAQLSKFENGQSMLSADKLIYLWSAVGLTMNDFSFHASQTNDTGLYTLIDECHESYKKNDAETLNRLFFKLKTNSHENLLQELTSMIVLNYLSLIQPHTKIDDKSIESLTYYLYDIEQWSEFDFLLYSHTLNLLKKSDIIFLGKSLLDKRQSYLKDLTYHRLFHDTLLSLIHHFLDQRDFFHLEYFISTLRPLLSSDTMHEKIWIDFFNLESLYLREKINVKEIDYYLNRLEEFATSDLICDLNQHFRAISSSFTTNKNK